MKMITKLWSFLGSFLIVATSLIGSPQSTDFSQKSKPATIKVLLQRQAREIVIEVKGRHYIYNPLDGTQISSGLNNKRFPVFAEQYGIKWGESFPGCHQLRFVPGDSQSSILVNGVQYKGCIEIYQNDGKFNIINEVDVENYLRSALSAEFQRPLVEEVMNAITIVARTNAYFLAKRNQEAFWHVVASDVGYEGQAMLPRQHIDHSVETTRHAVLTFNGAPFAATWTEDSAGKTVDFAAVFRRAVSTPPGVVAPIAAQSRLAHKWSCTLPKTLLAEATDLSRVTGIDLYLTPEAEKVYAVKISGETHVKDFDFVTFQKIVGKNKLRSNDFRVETKGDELVFTGYGEGPGVGLCLLSAKALAEKGEKAPQILQAFFPDTKLEKIKSY